MKMFDVDDREILYDIQPVEMAAYKTAVEEYVNCFSSLKGVLWIGQFGTIKSPGISDLDLLVVCEDECYGNVNCESKRFIARFPLYGYIFWHDVIVVPRSIAKSMSYMHSLENLRELWSASGDVPVCCDRPGGTAILFRTVLWNSFFWSLFLTHCRREVWPLRLTLLLSKNALISAAENRRLMGEENAAAALRLRSEEERQDMLNACPEDRKALAGSHFREAIADFYETEWAMNDWMSEKFGLGTWKKSKRLLLKDHCVKFGDLQGRNSFFGGSINGKQTVILPPFYYSAGCYVTKPYLRVCPGFARVWDTAYMDRHPVDEGLRTAGRHWDEVFRGIFYDMESAGIDPGCYEFIIFPFNLRPANNSLFMRGRNRINKLIKNVFPGKSAVMCAENDSLSR